MLLSINKPGSIDMSGGFDYLAISGEWVTKMVTANLLYLIVPNFSWGNGEVTV